jgi:uncharacterized protein
MISKPIVSNLIVQATAFCNLDCSYCYLPHRSKKGHFDLSLIPYLFSNIIKSEMLDHKILWDWHAGEPMVLGYKYFESAQKKINEYKPIALEVSIGMQTNATLVNANWVSFFSTNNYRIGVSIDGPEFIHDHNRKYRSGKGSFFDTMRGTDLLRASNVPFYLICVLSKFSLQYPDEMFYFFKSSGAMGVAFNIEEIEGINTQSSLVGPEAEVQFEKFFDVFFSLYLQHNKPFRIRELEKIEEVVSSAEGYVNGTSIPFAILTIASNGDFSTFSPELLSMKSEKYGSFIYGNIKDDLLIDAIKKVNLKKVYADIRKGVKACKSSCSYYETCGGGYVSNKYFENGTFASTETMRCRLMEKKVFDIAKSFITVPQGLGV